MAEAVKVPGICRICSAHCGVLVTVEDGRAVKVEGDRDNPVFQGYTCPKGRALADMHNDPDRLLHSQKRQADGSFAKIGSAEATDEIAARIDAIVAEHGPRSVAIYAGTNLLPYPASGGMANAFIRALGSPMFFTANTIDQPGKQIALAAHGHWCGGDLDFNECDSWMLLGTNPIISKSIGVPGANPAQRIKQAAGRGMQLIVIDPRRSQTADKAAIHLQPQPGEDVAILAGMIRLILAEGLHDRVFVEENVAGLEALAAAVEPFTPDFVSARAGVPAEQLVEAVRVFATHGDNPGMVHLGTGANFALHGNLAEYLGLCLNSILGRWQKAGRKVTRPNAMLPAYVAKAQAVAPYQGWGYGERMRVRGLGDAACGMPTAALADEILLEGEGQVRALICLGGNPLAAWPDQRKTRRAMAALDLLITLDVEMSLTSRLAHYVIAPKMQLETPGMSLTAERIKYYTSGTGVTGAYAQYGPRVVAPPAGSDLIEEWEFFWGIGARLGLEMTYINFFGSGQYVEAPPVMFTLNKDTPLTTEELLGRMCSTSRIPLDEVAAHPHGHVFPVDAVVAPRDPDCEARLDVGNAELLGELAEVLAEHREEAGYPFRLIPRRHNNYMNSNGPRFARLNVGKPYNPLYMHPDDIARLGLTSGDDIRVASEHDAVPAVLEADPTLRPSVVAMHHACGGLPEEDGDFRMRGSNVGRLVASDSHFDALTGMPRFGNIPVAVERAGVPA